MGPEQIFEELDFQSLMNSRLGSQSWKDFIDERAHQWSSIKNEIAEMKEKCENGHRNPFHFACNNGQDDIAEIIMKNSVIFNIDLNAEDVRGMTAFHEACCNDH